MSCILYYSNQCENSRKLLQTVAKGSAHKDIHFMCIDKRIRVGNAWYIVLENGERVILPPQVDRVPALLLLADGHKILFGEQIKQYLQPRIVVANNAATQNNGEPFAFSIYKDCMGGYGVTSDNFSFLDQSSEELSAKGSGGLRQMYNYATIDFNDNINTPAEDYVPDKVGSISMEQLQQKRNSEVSAGGGVAGGANAQFQQQQQQQRNFYPPEMQQQRQQQQQQQQQQQYQQQQQQQYQQRIR